MNTVVVDAKAITKTFTKEPDSQVALDFLRACVSERVQIVAPDLILYEVAQIAVKIGIPLDQVISLFEDHISTLIELKTPDRFAWLQSEKICQSGHEKSGFPSMYDSIYHAMAIIEDGVFLTADRRHHAKSKEFGHIALLKDWQGVLSSM